MKKTGNILWGILILALGAFLGLKAFFPEFEISFDGWWTLFIILPCLIGLFTEREKLGNLIGIGIGVLLLLACQDVIDFSMLWKLIVPFILIMIGLKMIFGSIFNKKANSVSRKLKKDGKEQKSGTAVFSGNRMNLEGQEFYGAELNSIFGSLTCNLNGAVIHEDCVINACAVFGGIDVLVPDGFNVKIHSTSIFGSASDKKNLKFQENLPTIYINATCIFGGLDVK